MKAVISNNINYNNVRLYKNIYMYQLFITVKKEKNKSITCFLLLQESEKTTAIDTTGWNSLLEGIQANNRLSECCRSVSCWELPREPKEGVTISDNWHKHAQLASVSVCLSASSSVSLIISVSIGLSVCIYLSPFLCLSI